MIKKNSLVLIVLFSLLSFFLIITSCEKNFFTNNPEDRLIFSTDTVQFDTIFTQKGSATKFFIIKNSHKSKSIVIDKIYLGSGKNSVYRLNIDGFPVNNIENYELAGGDSLFIFVEVTINPGANDLVEEDSVVFLSNGNMQNVKLVAFGQNVTLLNGQFITSDTTWTDAKPVLIYNSALVEENVTLQVNQGAKVYFHRGASLFVKGSLKVHGNKDNRVLFTGDRLENYYSELAGQWGAFIEDENKNTVGIFGGIHLLAGSKNSEINFADIKNSIIGLQVDSCVTPGTPTVKLNSTNIENSKIIGLYALGSTIEAENCVFSNSGQYNLACLIGGDYKFLHCTMANYWVGNRQTPQLILNNYYNYRDANGNIQTSYRDLKDAYFGNCIIYGSKDNEIKLDFDNRSLTNFRFDNCLIKQKDYKNFEGTDFFIDNIWNENPKFKEITKPYDYELDTLSPAKDIGKLNISQQVPLDQLGNNRLLDGKPDLGAFERQED
ncbi:MAG: hypothetical protein GX793_02070 [Bacteroidales bacterium]|jgi:hypothetical protein|nr:hypothetical protein [Bacteroidales bacterium]MDY0314782.1 hypothetical protein [Bacteroidales bacterium]NLB85826.1 hypothetical protein [Bacteroidales bacterium]